MADKEHLYKDVSSLECVYYRGKSADFDEGVMFILEQLDAIPEADVAEVRYGEWVYDPDGCDWGIGAWRCSLCSAKNDNLGISRDINPYWFEGSKFCPHCGATMRKGGSNDEVC